MEALLRRTTDLINAGHFRKADIELKQAGDTQTIEHADYWIQLAQLAWLKGNEAEAEHYGVHGRKCADWDAVIHEGSFHRDAAHWFIRSLTTAQQSSATLRHEVSARRAKESLDAAEELFKDDTNLTGSITMAKAKLEYARQNYSEAVELHLLADVQLQDLVWKRNNQFHLLRASRFSTGSTPSGLGLILTKRIVQEDPSFKHRLAACVILLTGKFGCRLYDRIAA